MHQRAASGNYRPDQLNMNQKTTERRDSREGGTTTLEKLGS